MPYLVEEGKRRSRTEVIRLEQKTTGQEYDIGLGLPGLALCHNIHHYQLQELESGDM